MTVSTDAAANLIGVYGGEGRRSIAIGSHTDTVAGGGLYDGVSGLLTALECIWTMKDSEYRPQKNIICVDFLAEEPSEFGLSCIGSRLATGRFSMEMLLLRHEKTKEVLRSVIDKWGGDTSLLAPGRSQFAKYVCDAFFELHIEQGRILEDRGLDVGLVEGICSVTRYEIIVLGRGGHAGNTPMHMRADALLAAARLVSSIAEIANEIKKLENSKHFTATVGRMDIFANEPNIIAEKTFLTLDIRSEEDLLVDRALESLFATATNVARETGTTINFNKISRGHPVASDRMLVDLLENNARKLGLGARRMISGAGHDAAYMGKIMPMAMLFIPCQEGRSHVPTEQISQDQLERGANLLLQTLLDISG